MWQKKKISVVFPCYNEEKNIKKAINEFFSTGIVDEIIAVDNNSKDNTAEEIKKTKAKYVLEKKQGYGNALTRGLYESTGDLIFTAEPDGTFLGKDIFKFLPYSDQFDSVFGTRTSKSLIWEGAKMDWMMRIANVIVAKFLEYMYNGPCLTDVGCTMKLISRKGLNKIKNQFTVGKSHFSPEFMILCLKNKLKVIEIPVNYARRIGESKITANFWKSAKLAIIMIGLIIRYKFVRSR